MGGWSTSPSAYTAACAAVAVVIRTARSGEHSTVMMSTETATIIAFLGVPVH